MKKKPNNKKPVPKTAGEKFTKLEKVNPALRELAETFDLVIRR